MLMLGSILVPLDGSALADDVLPHVERLALHNEGTVHLLRVLRPATEPGAPAGDDEATAREHLRGVRARLEELELQVEVHVVTGEPAVEIVEASARLRVGLIAMASHGRGGLLRWIRGSVAETVLRHARTPVLLLSAHAVGRAPARGFRRILVPLDGSERAAAVLPYVIVLAAEAKAEVEVILARVAWPSGEPLLAGASSPDVVAASLRPFAERLASAGVAARVLALQGDAAAELLDAAEREQVDLLALASHGRSGLGRLLDGSVAEKVLRHCRHPLLVVRAPA